MRIPLVVVYIMAILSGAGLAYIFLILAGWMDCK